MQSIPPTLAQELQDLANLHNAPPIDSPPAPEIGTEKRVVLPEDNIVQEEMVELPTLAFPNPVHTVPVAPLLVLPPLPTTYPPPPGLPPLPDTDRPNTLMGPSISSPTVPAEPKRRSPREHIVRTYHGQGLPYQI